MNAYVTRNRAVARVPRCRHTGLTIPECSCPRCLEDQERRVKRGMQAGAAGAGARR